MVSSQISGLTRANAWYAFGSLLLHPMGPSAVVTSENEEYDFSDLFGSTPTQLPTDVNTVTSDCSKPVASDDLVYNEPMVILSRSHSLVGPTARVCQSPRLRKHTLNETELELIEYPSGTEVGQEKPSSCSAECEGISQSERNESAGLEDFDFLKVVGKGAFGKVFQVMKKGTSEIYAMKVVRKDKIIEKNHAEYMKAERDILTKVNHPYIVQLRYSFQTKYRLYLVLDFVNGGHLFFQLYREGLFREDLACIYTAEIVSAVSHLHANGIMHRDLKPENILLDADGHVMLTDFGLAKQFEENTRSNSMCGTVEYMAPEIVQAKGHDKAADWWSVGILLFEMLTGKPPFIGGNRDKIQQKIVKDKLKLPAYLSSEVHSLLKGLLQKEPSKRLGSGPGGSNEIKNHKWFKSINWRKLEAREIHPSFRPNVAGKICVANFEECWTSMPLTISPVASPAAGSCNFPGFSYVKPSEFLPKPSPLG